MKIIGRWSLLDNKVRTVVVGKTKKSVSSADFLRNFAKIRQDALVQPVFVTSYGRETHVLQSIEDFESVAGSPEQAAEDVRLSVAKEFGTLTSEALIICNKDSEIEFCNQVAGSLMRRSVDELTGKTLREAHAGYGNSLMENQARRTILSNERTSADMPSPFLPDHWIHFRSYPWHQYNVLVFREITEHVQNHRLANVKEAILEGMSIHGSIGYVRLSMRGTIERADQPFCEALGIPEERLIGANLADLASRSSKVLLRDTMEQVMQSGEGASLEVEFLDNSGGTHAMRAGIVALRGAYGWEGAVILLTPSNGS